MPKKSFILIVLLVLLLPLNTQIIMGCVRYYTDNFLQTKCIQCYSGMGLTSTGGCEMCQQGQVAVGGVCQTTTTAVNANANANANGNGQQISSISTSNSNIWFNGISAFSNGQNYLFMPTTPQTSQTNQPTVSLSINNFIQPIQPSPQPIPQPVTQPTKIPQNCIQYSQITQKCTQCKQNYTLELNGLCIVSKIQQNNNIIINNNNEINLTQSYDPSIILPVSMTVDVTEQKSVWGADFQQNDFSYFGVQTSDGFQSDGLSSAGSNSNTVQPINTQQTPSQPLNLPQPTSPQDPTPPTNTATTPTPNTSTTTTTSTNPKQSIPVIHKYPEYPYCFDYSDGQCWACIPNYLLNLILNQCIPYQKPASPNLSALASNSTGREDNPSPPAPTDPSDNCNNFSPEQKLCKQCFRNYYLDKQNKICKVVDPLCRTYDPDNGKCLTCYNKYVLNSGKCVTN